MTRPPGSSTARTTRSRASTTPPGWPRSGRLSPRATPGLPETRLTVGPVVSFENFVVYSSFKMVFPKTKGSTSSLQFADVAFYPLPEAMGINLLSATDPILAIEMGWQSSYPAAEAPAKVIDGDVNTKYLNFGKLNSGVIVTPALGATLLDGIQVTTANDSPERDPVVWMVYGTNDAIVTLDNGDGKTENWTLICGGTLALPAERLTVGPVYVIANQAEAYTSYKVLFPTVKDAAKANSMQIAEIQLFGTVVVPPVVEPNDVPQQ